MARSNSARTDARSRLEALTTGAGKGGRHFRSPARRVIVATMAELPSGTVTLLFTDIEGSTLPARGPRTRALR